jgi:hypothetical protein
MDVNANILVKPGDLGKSPHAVARRWKLELKLADKRESAWRKKAADIYKTYTPESPALNSFNILWSNTETLRQSVYNSLPQPDARRRYQDEDPLGKAVGDVLTRALEFCQDTYDFDAVLKGDVLSMLLPGRGLSRVRYVPDIRKVESERLESAETAPDSENPEQDEANPNHEALEGDAYEEIAWEQVICERVQWDDFRVLCAAKTWEEVSAIGFRHRFTREDCVEKFGEEIGNAIPLNAVDDEDVKKSKDVGDLFQTAEVWEIWDKDAKEVLFICTEFSQPCKVQDDPLQLQGFFPCPRPLYAIENDQTLIPAALYTQYEQQAKELNRISMRINKIIDALKVRGIYDSTLSELSELMKSADNDLVPAMNASAFMERGGLEKAIWMMPIDVAAAVLKELYAQRDSTKQIVYEITGISDIMRSASDPGETFGAQKIKTQWGTQRLQRLQKEVQRYIRDLIRIKAEVISSKFQPETLAAMTLIDLPHQAQINEQKAQQMAQYQQAAQLAKQQNQPPPAPPQQQPYPITWEAVTQAMQNDATRTYRIDIETDSTLSATQDSDMSGLKELLTGLAQIMQSFGPAVQQGAMDVSVLKELMLVVTRRARLGTAVEDVISKIQQPKPQGDPNAAKMQAEQMQQQAQMQHEQQMQQMKNQSSAQLEQMKAQLQDQQHQRELQMQSQLAQMDANLKAQVERDKQQAQAAQNQHQNELEQQREMFKQQSEAALDQLRVQSDERLKQIEHNQALLITQLNNQAKIEVAEIAANTTLQAAQMSAAKQSEVSE